MENKNIKFEIVEKLVEGDIAGFIDIIIPYQNSYYYTGKQIPHWIRNLISEVTNYYDKHHEHYHRMYVTTDDRIKFNQLCRKYAGYYYYKLYPIE